MIKYNVIKKMFEIDYRYECTKRGKEKEYIAEGVLTTLIYDGVRDLSSRIGIGIRGECISIKKGISSYLIDGNFLRLVTVEVGGEVLTPIIKYSDDILRVSGFGPVKFYSVEELYKTGKMEISFYPAPLEDTTATVNYMGIEQPYLEGSEEPSETGGEIESKIESVSENYETIEPEFLIAVKLYVLKYFFPDKSTDYEIEIERIKYRRKLKAGVKGGFSYRFGI